VEVHAPDLAVQLEAAGIRPAPESGPLRLRDLVVCPLGGELLAERCAIRHTAVWPSGGRIGAPRWIECARCRAGAGYLVRLEGFTKPAPSQPAEVLSRAARAARARWVRSFPAFSPGTSRGRENWEPEPASRCGELEPIREAALCSPDDPNVREWTPD
jgi:hypothetical protein